MCSSRRYPYLPHGSLFEIQMHWGSQKPKGVKGKYEARLEFPEGWVPTPFLSVGLVRIFSGIVRFLVVIVGLWKGFVRIRTSVMTKTKLKIAYIWLYHLQSIILISHFGGYQRLQFLVLLMLGRCL